MKKIVKKAIILISAMLNIILIILSVYLYRNLKDARGGMPFPTQQSVMDEMESVEDIFYERKEVLEQITGVLKDKTDVMITYQGITEKFIHDKTSVDVYEELLQLTETDIETIVKMFGGHDRRLFDDWEINGGDNVEFTFYKNGPYSISMVQYPNNRPSPRILYPAFHVKHLEDGWVMMALDRSLPANSDEWNVITYDESSNVD